MQLSYIYIVDEISEGMQGESWTTAKEYIMK